MRKVGLSKRSSGAFSAPSRSPASNSIGNNIIVKVKREEAEETSKLARAESVSAVKQETSPWRCTNCQAYNEEFANLCEFCDTKRNSPKPSPQMQHHQQQRYSKKGEEDEEQQHHEHQQQQQQFNKKEKDDDDEEEAAVAPARIDFVPAARVRDQQVAKVELQKNQEILLSRVKAAVQAVTDNPVEAAYVNDVIKWLLAGEQTRRLTLNTALAALDTVLVNQREFVGEQLRYENNKAASGIPAVVDAAPPPPPKQGAVPKVADAEVEQKTKLSAVAIAPPTAKKEQQPHVSVAKESSPPVLSKLQKPLEPLKRELETPKPGSIGSNFTLKAGGGFDDDEDDDHVLSQGLGCFLKSIDGDDPVIRVTWDVDASFGRRKQLEVLGFSKDENRFIVEDPRVSSNHCRVSIIDGVKIMLSDTSTNGTCAIIQGKNVKIKGQSIELHFGDVFSLCCSDDFTTWKHSWQVCRAPSEKLVSLPPRPKEINVQDSPVIAQKKKRAPPTTESMARLAKSEGEAALAAVLQQAGKKAKAGPRVITAAEPESKKKKKQETETPQPPQKRDSSLLKLVETRKRAPPEPASIVVFEDDDEIVIPKRATAAPPPATKKQVASAPSLSFSLDLV